MKIFIAVNNPIGQMTPTGEKRKPPQSMPAVSWKSVGIAAAIWLLLGLSFASEAYLRHYKLGMLSGSWWSYAAELLTYTYIYALFSPLVFVVGRKIPLASKVGAACFLGRALLHLLFSLVFAAISLGLGIFIAAQWQDERLCRECLGWATLLDPFLLHRGVMIYWGLIFVGRGIDYFRRFNTEKIRAAELSAQLSEAQLNALKMQIHPHFLFNTLNSIVGLIHEDKASAELMTTKLSDFLRMTLQSSNEEFFTLERELYFLKTYLDIEKVRFQERLAIVFEADEQIFAAKVPHLILQPLVENAVKHGISRLKENGRITISAVRRENRLILKVADNGNLAPENQADFPVAGTGTGMKNVKARLTQIYGVNFSLKFAKNFEISTEKDAGKGTTVTIDIPFET